jgi:hypothetical protein
MYQLPKLIRFYNKIFKKWCYNQDLYFTTKNYFCTNNKPAIILGIETSCDDTGMAVIDTTGKILGEALHSQLDIHLP